MAEKEPEVSGGMIGFGFPVLLLLFAQDKGRARGTVDWGLSCRRMTGWKRPRLRWKEGDNGVYAHLWERFE